MFFTRYEDEQAVSEQTTHDRLQALKDKILARKQQQVSLQQQENASVNKQDNTAVNKQENTGVNKQEHTAVNKQDNTAVNKQEHTAVNKQEHTEENKHAHPKKRRKLSGPPDTEDQPAVKRKKKKKNKSNVEESGCEHVVEVQTSETVEVVPKTKKKKSKKSKRKIDENETQTTPTEETAEEGGETGRGEDASKEETKEQEVEIEESTEQTKVEESEKEEWTILGKEKSEKPVLEDVKRALPDWIVHHEIIDPDFTNKVLLEKCGLLDRRIVDVLEKMDIKSLFPMQAQIIPVLLSGCTGVTMLSRDTHTPPPDICVSAPTGSGKTLVYVLSLVQCLMSLPPMLQAVVIVPTKNLANQVKRVFNHFQNIIKVVLLSGKDTFPSEQKQLYTEEGLCQAHVAVATPGRLVNHLRDTTLFTLQHLRFLVIDEMDTLLTQTYQDYLPSLFSVVYNTSPYQHALQPRYNTLRYTPGNTLSLAELRGEVRLPLQKVLLSATVTHDPGKLAPLQLYRPVLYCCGEKYTLPPTLQQYQIRCSLEEKALVILHLVAEVGHVLCFTSSLDTAHRLALLAEEYGGVRVAEYSSTLSTQQRNKVVRDFALRHIHLLVCSDSLARGMDIAQVDHVVNYDVPAHVQTYVHRVGRTARAGRPGTAYTLIRHEETRHFHQILKKAGNTRATDYNVPEEAIERLSGRYQDCLTQLEKRLKHKKNK